MLDRIALLLCVALLASPALSAADEADKEIRGEDVVYLKEGRTLRGTITNETKDVVTIAAAGGTGTFPMSDIDRIVRRNPPERAYGFRADDAVETFDSQFEIATWCVEVAQLLDEGEKHFLDANRLNPQDRRTYEALLELFARQDEAEKTPDRRNTEMGVYLRGIDEGITLLQLPYRAAVSLAYSGESTGAIHLLKKMLDFPYAQDEPETQAQAQNLLAQLLESEGRRPEARALVDRILSGRDDDAAIGFLLMRSSWLLEDFAAGNSESGAQLTESLDKIFAIDPTHGRANALRACQEMLQEEFTDAAKSISRSLQGGVLELMTAAALNYARSGDFKKAADALGRIKPNDETRFEHSAVKAYLLQNLGEDEAAAKLLQELVDTGVAPWQIWILYLQSILANPSEEDDSAVLARVEEETGRYLEQFAANPVAFSECAVFLGDLALRRGDGTKARRWLDYVAVERTPDAELLLRIGQAHLLPGGERRRAREALTQAHELDDEDLDIRNSLGYLEYLDGELAKSRAWFEGVLDEFPDKEVNVDDPPPVIAYALRGREQAHFGLREEMWSDTFGRESGERVDNNWEQDQKVGIDIRLRNGTVHFDGRQRAEDDGLTVLWRRLESLDRISRVRARVRAAKGIRARIGLRLEEETGLTGLVLYRDLDGTLAFSLNNEGSPPEDVKAPPEDADDEAETAGGNGDGEDDDKKDPYAMRRVIWEDDGEEHIIEIRLVEGKRQEASLYFDGQRVARNVRLPVNRRTRGLRVGVSGQAAIDTTYRFEVSEFQIFRFRPDGRELEKR